MITTEMINRVLRLDSGGLPVVSLYVGVDQHPRSRGATRTRISSLLHEIRPMVEDRSVSREVRLSLRGDIERIEDRASEQLRPPGTVAMFSCSRAGLFEEFHLPRIVRDRIVANTTPWLRPMLAVLDEYHRTCVATVDQGWAQLWEPISANSGRLGRFTMLRCVSRPTRAGMACSNTGCGISRIHQRGGITAGSRPLSTTCSKMRSITC